MRRFLTSLLILWSGCLLLSGAEIELTVLATADLHGRLAVLTGPVTDAVREAGKRNPGGVLYVDAGDAAQGTLAVWQMRGAGVPAMLHRAGCAVWVPGNHELEFGFDAFMALGREFPGAVLAANLEAPELADKVARWRIFTRRGVKIGVIGLMLPVMNNRFPVSENRFETAYSEAALRRSVGAVLDAGAEVVLLVRHGGIYGGGENLYTLLSRVPGVDLTVGAHTHQGEPGRKIANSWYMQPPAHGGGLARATIVFDDRTRRIVRIESALQPLAALTEDSAGGERSAPLPSPPVETLAVRAMRRAVGADVAIYSAGDREALKLLARNPAPTALDYYRAYPYYDAVVTAELTAAEIRTILAEYGAFADRRKELLTADGVEFHTRRGELTGLEFSVKKARYRVAMSSYAAAGAGGALPETRKIWRDRLDYATVEKAPPLLECLLGAGL